MSFSLANPTGWTTGDLLTETQINQLDAEHAAAIDGSGGGTYSLSAPLILNGSNVTIGQSLYVTGSAAFNGSVQLGDSGADAINIQGTIEAAYPATFYDDVTFNDPVAINDNVTITNKDLIVTGASGRIVLNTGCHISGGSEGFLLPGAQGCVNKKVVAITSGTGDISVDPEFYDTVLVSGISGDVTIVLGTPPTNGYHVTISNYSTLNYVSFKPFGGSIFGNSLKAVPGQFWLASLVWYSGVWYATSYSPYVP